jgi:site-specific recombinase XerD
MNRYNRSDKVRESAAVPLVSKRLLDQVRERIRYLHYSLQTEKAYVYWTRFFVRWSGTKGGMRHPRELGSAEVEAFLTMLANERQVSPATHRQALNALLFLYRQVLGMDLPWMQQIGRPPGRKRIPVVLTQDEIQRVLSMLAGEEAVLARLLYGAGLRLNEGLSLQVKDLDFDRHAVVVRSGKGYKDRVVCCPDHWWHHCVNSWLGRRRCGPVIGQRKWRVSFCPCAGAQVSTCRAKLGLALGFPLAHSLGRSSNRGGAAPPPVSRADQRLSVSSMRSLSLVASAIALP